MILRRELRLTVTQRATQACVIALFRDAPEQSVIALQKPALIRRAGHLPMHPGA